MAISYAVLTSSDTGSAGKRVDSSGDAVVEILERAGHTLVERVILPDDFARLSEQITTWCDAGNVDLVVLSHDPTLVAPDFIREIQVQQTYVDGDLVYSV